MFETFLELTCPQNPGPKEVLNGSERQLFLDSLPLFTSFSNNLTLVLIQHSIKCFLDMTDILDLLYCYLSKHNSPTSAFLQVQQERPPIEASETSLAVSLSSDPSMQPTSCQQMTQQQLITTTYNNNSSNQ